MRKHLFMLAMVGALTPWGLASAQDMAPVVSDDYAASDCCDVCCEPLWTARASFLAITRDDPDDIPFIVVPGGPNLVNLGAFDFEYNSAWEGSLLRDFGCCKSAEVRYMALLDTGDEVSIGAFGGGTAQFATTPPSPFVALAGWNVIAEYDADLHSGEFNLRHACGSLTLLAGARYIDFQEQIHADVNIGPASDIQWTTNTHNRIYGGQLGAEYDSFIDACCRFSFRGFAKFGAFYNDAEHETTVMQIAGDTAFTPFIYNDGTATGEDLTLVGETGAYLTMHLDNCWAVSVGYQLLWLDGVALAANQIPESGNVFAAPPLAIGINTDNEVLYHGANIGIERRW